MPTTLTKGADCPAPADRIAVEVACGAPIDVSALLVTASGRVRGDHDLVFSSNPAAPGVRHRRAGAEPEAVVLDLPEVPAEIDRVVVAASLDGSGPATFGESGPLEVTVRQPGRAPEVVLTADGLSSETAILVVEVYRRQGAWRVRGVAQGCSSGLGGIATDFGIAVEDEPAPAAAASPPPPPPRPAGGAVNLDEGRVSLAKGGSVSLVKTGAPPLARVRMGLGWDPADSGRNIDLDASCILYDARRRKVDMAWFMRKRADGGAVRHSGDNLTGAGEGDDEVIRVDLERLSQRVTALVFTVNSYQGQTFDQIRNAFCRLVDDATGQELVRFEISEMERSTGVIMCKLTRDASGAGPWEMTALGRFHDGRTVRAMIEPAAALL